MKKQSQKSATLSNGIKIEIAVERIITEIKGDAWEGRPDEILHIENVAISFVHPDGTRHTGNCISQLFPKIDQRDADAAKKGAVAKINNTPMFLSQASHDLVKAALDAAFTETDSPEWQAYVAAEKAKAVRAEKNAAEIHEMEQRQIKNGLCPKCGSYCYGDCEA